MRHFCFVALLLISSYSLAASFDCNNASTNIEKIICSNNELFKIQIQRRLKKRKQLQTPCPSQRLR